MQRMIRASLLLPLAALLSTTVEWGGAPAAPADPYVSALKLPEGFVAERLYSPGMQGQGSWVSMTFDDRGRMIASDQHGNLYRLRLPRIGADTSEKAAVERLELHVPGDTSRAARMLGHCHGLLYAFNSLYCVVNDEGDRKGSRPSGIYRLRDSDGDDRYDRIDLLRALQGAGEHGPHSIVLSPDGASLYVVAGNFTRIPAMDAYANPPVWQNDNLLPFLRDPNGHDDVVQAHGGWIARFDPDGRRITLVASGFRNPFDAAFNERGDLFTFDSDMEWDMGTPWYRPTRICHVTEGAEFGWRPGTAKWSPEYADNLPAVLDIGQGSPTSVFSGMHARFPDRYRRAIFAFDWSFGIIYAVHPEPVGAGYRATAEEFISGSPLPLTDGMIGPDGALYFLTGGRRIESHLYRVRHVDHDRLGGPLEVPSPTPETGLRRALEALQSAPATGDVDSAWRHLAHPDRQIRHAARMVLEHRPAAAWKPLVEKEEDPRRLAQAAIALSRMGERDMRDGILSALSAIAPETLDRTVRLEVLRAVELALLRLGIPDEPLRSALTAAIDRQYPASDPGLDRALGRILLGLQAPGFVGKTMALLRTARDGPVTSTTATSSADLILRNPQYGIAIGDILSRFPPQQQTYLAVLLCAAEKGWTPALREEYFTWFRTAFSYRGGYSYVGFIDLARNKALAQLPEASRKPYAMRSGDSLVAKARMGLSAGMRQPKGPGQNWTVEKGMQLLKDGMGRRDFESGKAMFAAGLCGSCHAVRGEGGVSGPDLTQLGSRFGYRDMLTAIIEPNKAISDQYGSTVFYLRNGGTVLGRLIREEGDGYVIAQNPFSMRDTRTVPKAEVLRTRVSEISPMLPHLVNRFNGAELLDLLAYLKSGGNPQDPVFAKK